MPSVSRILQAHLDLVAAEGGEVTRVVPGSKHWKMWYRFDGPEYFMPVSRGTKIDTRSIANARAHIRRAHRQEETSS